MKKTVGMIVLSTVMLSGCMGTYLKVGVDAYCGKPQAAREVARDATALLVAPNKIKIECFKDG